MNTMIVLLFCSQDVNQRVLTSIIISNVPRDKKLYNIIIILMVINAIVCNLFSGYQKSWFKILNETDQHLSAKNMIVAESQIKL